MAFVDKLTEFANALGVTSGGITDVVDLGTTPTLRALAMQNQCLVLNITTLFDPDAGDPATTVVFDLVSDSAAALTTSPTVHWSSDVLNVADMVAGLTVAIVPLPMKANYERYLGLSITLGGGTPGVLATGAISAYLTPDPSLRTLYPNAI